MESRTVPTAHGPSHALVGGDPGGPVLVALHGSLSGSAHLLSEAGPILERFRVVAPDLPGQSARGPAARLSYADDALARWLFEVLDGLGVRGRFDLLGVSLGGFVARKAALAAPDRVRKLVLLVPAGVVAGSAWAGLTRVALPLLRHRVWPTARSGERLARAIFTTPDPDWDGATADANRDFVLDLRIPPLATDDELRRLPPVLAIGAEDDVFFPGRPLVERVKRVAPVAETELLAGAKHGPPTTPEFRRWLGERVGAFLGG